MSRFDPLQTQMTWVERTTSFAKKTTRMDGMEPFPIVTSRGRSTRYLHECVRASCTTTILRGLLISGRMYRPPQRPPRHMQPTPLLRNTPRWTWTTPRVPLMLTSMHPLHVVQAQVEIGWRNVVNGFVRHTTDFINRQRPLRTTWRPASSPHPLFPRWLPCPHSQIFSNGRLLPPSAK